MSSDGRPVLSYYDIADGAMAFSTQRGAASDADAYSDFNINEFCGDSPTHVARCREALAGEIGVPADSIVVPHQVHGTEACVINSGFLTMPAAERRMLTEGADAVMTDVRGVCIGVSTADCIPVLLYDEEHHAACAIHAGWRGTLQRITHKAVMQMGMVYGTRPGRLRAVVGPGISLDNFEVGDEVYEAFRQDGFDMARIARRMDKWHIDLPMANRLALEHDGVEPHNIAMSGVCTYDNADRYFSARRLGVNSGRIYTAICMRQQ